MLKVAKFGGSSMADAKQFEKVRDIVRADPARKVIVVSASGKRSADDHKLTDLLYLCYAHLQYGVSCDAIFRMICDRYIAIRDECGLNVDIEAELDVLRRQMRAGISEEELVSRGEYFSALLMADYLGYSFLDAELWVRFQFDGSIDKEASYAELQRLADGRSVVIPGFYGVTPDRKIRTFSRGGSDITGALAAAALNADVYENWTDVSGILMADPRIVPDPLPIERITYNELRELSFVGAQVLHEGTVFPVREKNIPLNIRNTNDPDHPGTLIMESFDDVDDGRLITSLQVRHVLERGHVPAGVRGVRAPRRAHRVRPQRHRLPVARRLERAGRPLPVFHPRRAGKAAAPGQSPRDGKHLHRRGRRPEDGLPPRHVGPHLRCPRRARHQHPHDLAGAG